jgi:hypothetical protein
MKSLKTLKESMKKKAAGLVQYIPKNGEMTVRFLEEPEGNWVKFGEHYDPMRRMSFPCIGDDCPGCEDNLRRSDRFLANVLDIEKDKAVVLQIPKGLAETLVKYYERNDTLMDRDYTLVREGEGLDTDYYPQPEEKMARKISKYEVTDLDVILEKMASAYLDDGDDDEEEEEEAPATKTRKRSEAAPKKRTRPPEPDEDEEDEDEEEEEEAPKKRSATKKAAPKVAPARRKRPDPEEEEEDEEEEDEEEEDEDEDVEEDEDEDEDDEDYYTESELNGMTVGALRVICKEYDIETTGLKKPDLVKAILG